MKVIFLDFDGVLNSEDWREHRLSTDSILGLDEFAVARLNQLVEQSGAHVVISSSWRKLADTETLQQRLDAKGFCGHLIGETPHYLGVGMQRGDEIWTWLDAHPEVDGYVILDDSTDMHGVADHFVHVDADCGLQLQDVEHALRILAQPREVSPCGS